MRSSLKYLANSDCKFIFKNEAIDKLSVSYLKTLCTGWYFSTVLLQSEWSQGLTMPEWVLVLLLVDSLHCVHGHLGSQISHEKIYVRIYTGRKTARRKVPSTRHFIKAIVHSSWKRGQALRRQLP